MAVWHCALKPSYQAGLDSARSPPVLQPHLLPAPLSLFYLTERVKKHSCVPQTNNVRTSWDAVWMAPEEIAREGIMISPHLLDDHYTATLEV